MSGGEPRCEGRVRVATARHLGFAEYGDPDGRAVLWFHGTPGGRRQVAPTARAAADRLGIRLIVIERPGAGLSTRHLYSGIGDFGTDVDIATRALGVERFACVGMSGGGPYALACAAHLPERVVAGAVLGGVVPTCGPDAPPGGALGFARRFAPLLEAAHVPLALVLHAGIRAAMPLRSLAFDLCMAVSPEGDKRVFSNPGIKTMFLDDIVQATRRHAHSPVFDAVLFMRDWGFALGDIRVPIRFWHGDADPLVPLAHAQHMVERVADAELRVRPGESHLAAFDLAAEVFDALLALWPGEAAAVSAPTGSAGSGTARVAAPAART